MKKTVAMVLAMLLCASAVAMTACEEGGTPSASSSSVSAPVDSSSAEASSSEASASEGITKEEWQEALAEQKFDNVTIHYTFDDGISMMNTVKIADGKVYRSATYMIGDQEELMEIVFEGEDAVLQRQMFCDIFLSLLAEKDNFVYDAAEGVYNAPEAVTATVSGGEAFTATEKMENGKVKFDETGKLEYFSCLLTESIYENDVFVHATTGEAVWTFSNYGTTVIETVEEAE